MTRQELFDFLHSAFNADYQQVALFTELELFQQDYNVSFDILKMIGNLGWAGTPTYDALERYFAEFGQNPILEDAEKFWFSFPSAHND